MSAVLLFCEDKQIEVIEVLTHSRPVLIIYM